MSNQFLREFELIIGNDESINVPNALKITNLRVKFNIQKDNIGTPNIAKISVYNLSENSRSKIEKEFTKLVLNVGYKNNIKLIFTGDILYVFHRKEGTNIISDIYTGDAQKSYLNSYFCKSYTPNVTYKEILEDVAESFNGVSLGGILNVPDDKNSLYGTSFCDQSKIVLNSLTSNLGLEWFIDNNNIYIYSPSGVINNDEKVFNATNGMIGSPVVTEIGINVKVLLRPDLICGTNFRVESLFPDLEIGSYFFKGLKPTKGEGIYRITKLLHIGDTHSEEWFTNIEGGFIEVVG